MRLSKILFVAVLALANTVPHSNASADVSGISMKFGGGCVKTNLAGSCILKPRFSGFDLETETAILYTCSSGRGGCKRYSERLHPVSEAGEVYMRIKNIPGGCFQVRTGRNGDEKPDVSSRILCEK